MASLSILPILAWVLFFGFLKSRGFGWRTAFLAASVTWGVAVTTLTEISSVFTALHLAGLATGWTGLAIAAGVLWYRSVPQMKTPLPSFSRIDKIIVAIIGGILACTFVTAVIAPPNNWDSLTYHMTRIMFWIQQESVRHFPTNNLRQIELNPWAEFAILHLQILSGGDRLANLVQWFSMAGCIIGVSFVSGLLGANRTAQMFAGLVAATIPMAVLQSSSTQNDLVVSFWLVCFVAFGINSTREKSRIWTVLMSCSLGLALLTKGTAYLYALPCVIWFLGQDLKRAWRTALPKYLLLAGIVLLVNVGHYQRNYTLFHNPLQSNNNAYGNGRLTPAVVLSNLSRNAALHLTTPSRSLNVIVIQALTAFHNVIGIALDDPDTTWPGMSPEALGFSMHEDLAGNFLHFCFFMVLGITIVTRKRFRKVVPYTAAILAGVLLFSLLLRWQPWASRLQLPMFVLFAPLAGVVASESGKVWLTCGLAALVSLAALPYALCNQTRPLISLPGHSTSIFSTPRLVLYFANDLNWGIASLTAVETLRKGRFRSIGLNSGVDSWEYPLWIMTHENRTAGPHIEHINVTNVSRDIPEPSFSPEVVVVIADDGGITLAPPRN